MAPVRNGLTLGTLAGVVIVVTTVAVALLLYAASTFVHLVPPVSAQSVVSLTF
jgi:hypothetical protein